MGINGTAVATAKVVVPESVRIELTDAGEIRRLGRILLAVDGLGNATDRFARELAGALGFTAENTRKQ